MTHYLNCTWKETVVHWLHCDNYSACLRSVEDTLHGNGILIRTFCNSIKTGGFTVMEARGLVVCTL